MISINLLKECQRIESKAINRKLVGSFENFEKITAPRSGFVKVSNEAEERAIYPSGRAVGASLERYEDPISGIKEHILSCRGFVRRMLFDKENKSIGTIAFDNNGNFPNETFRYRILTPAENGSTMEILPNGEKVLYKTEPNYDRAYGINAFGVMIEDVTGRLIGKFFGKK